MYPKKDIKISDNNIDDVIKEETFDTSSDHGLSKIKYEFDEEETKIQYGVFENQLTETNDLQFVGGEFSKRTQKIESTMNDMFSKKAIKIEGDEIKSENTEKNDEINTCLDSSNIKCEFEEEETKIHYGVFENQLQEEHFDKFTMYIPELQMLDGKFTKNFQKTELIISTMFSKEDIESARSQKTDSTIFSNKKSHVCEFCDQCFNTVETLNFHRTICRVGDYKCKISVTKVDQHNTQTKEKEYKCGTCNKCFTRTGRLSANMKIHTGEKPYKCETCGKCFAVKWDIKRHNRTHKGEKPYKCETCGKCFVEKGAFNVHNRIHSGEKPHKCDTCGKCFIEKKDLIRHNTTHIAEKPYKCETCGKCFSAKATLNLHTRTHTAEKHYKYPENVKKPYKYCTVPMCNNTTVSAPNKLFFQVLKQKDVRDAWCKIMRRAPISCYSTTYCCEDHFNLEDDIENYMEFKIPNRRPRLKKGVVPTRFHCQNRAEPAAPQEEKRRRLDDMEILPTPSTSRDILMAVDNLQIPVIEDTVLGCKPFICL